MTKKGKPYLLVLKGPRPGIYTWEEAEGRALAQRRDLRIRRYATLEDALAALKSLLVQGKVVRTQAGREEVLHHPGQVRLPSSPKAGRTRPTKGEHQYHARCDGSLREGEGSASAALVDKEGRTLSYGQLAYPKAESSLEAEVRGFLLALLLAPRGHRLRVETDLEGLARAWRGGEEGSLLQGAVRAARCLAELLQVQVEVVKVPRKRVEAAHQGAQQARTAWQNHNREAERAHAFLRGLPAHYRKAALDLLEVYRGDGRGLRAWLGRGDTPTRKLLLERLEGMEDEEVEALLQGVRALPQAVREALKGKDREEAWRAKPPTERQLAYLERLGYQGPKPANLEAHRPAPGEEGEPGALEGGLSLGAGAAGPPVVSGDFPPRGRQAWRKAPWPWAARGPYSGLAPALVLEGSRVGWPGPGACSA